MTILPTRKKISLPIGYDNFGAVMEQHLDFVDKTLFIQEIFENQEQVQLILRPRRFGKTLTFLYLHHGQRPWVLIDEYDSPIHTAFLNHYYEPMINLMRGVFGSTLKLKMVYE